MKNILYSLSLLFTELNIYILDVPNIKCRKCISVIESALNNMGEVDVISITLEQHQVVISSSRSVNDIINTMTIAGYPSTLK